MNGKERFLATAERAQVDRPASWLGLPTEQALPGLFAHFGVASVDALKRVLGDDVHPVEVPFHRAPANHIACAFDFAKRADGASYQERTLTASGFFEDFSDPAGVEDFDWPEPSAHMSLSACREAICAAPQEMTVMGVMWSAHFQDACAAFGMETAIVKMLTEPEMFRAVIDRIVGFYLKANEIFYEAGRGKLDAVLIGNDFGTQSGLMLSPELLRRFVFPGTRMLIGQAKSYGLKVVHHSCGGISAIAPDLIEMGVDVIHPIQALAAGMEPRRLKAEFGGRVAFCGGVDAQRLLVEGAPEEVAEKVFELREIFPTGLIISPSQHKMQR